MLGKAKWWEKKTVKNAQSKSHYEAWCVIEQVKGISTHREGLLFDIEYVAMGRNNVPQVLRPKSMTFKQADTCRQANQRGSVRHGKDVEFCRRR